MPKISVVLPARNAERTIDAAVASVLAQTFADFELLVVDDGSTDGTAACVARAAARDARVRLLPGDARGITHALNRGLAAAAGEYIARHDADDLSAPERFARQVAYLDTHANVCAVGTAASVMDDAGVDRGPLPTTTGPGAVREGIRSVRVTPVHGSMMIRRTALAAVGGYRTAFRSCQDFDLWLRLLERWDLDNLPEPLYRWRLSATATFDERRTTQLMYGGIGLVFAEERADTQKDSYEQLDAIAGDLEAFADRYARGSRLRAIWGELLLRGVNDPRLAYGHLRRAVRGGDAHLKTLALLAWTWCGLGWMGGKPLRPSTPAPASRS